jgi:hypothetical protein
MKILTPLAKGLITGFAMLCFTLILYYTKASVNLQLIIYAIYAAGIAWTLVSISKTVAYTGKFSELFGQGFRCFIVVTLIMVVSSAIFVYTHPKEFVEPAAVEYREALVKEKKMFPAAINTEIARFKKQFLTRFVQSSVFGYLISGAIFTAAGAGLIVLRRK